MSLFTDCPNFFFLEQMVDLSDNALTAILPVVIMALELPHLEADLADNPWQCDYSLAVFQNVISESWRKRWNAVCNESIGKSVVPLLSEVVETMTAASGARVH